MILLKNFFLLKSERGKVAHEGERFAAEICDGDNGESGAGVIAGAVFQEKFFGNRQQDFFPGYEDVVVVGFLLIGEGHKPKIQAAGFDHFLLGKDGGFNQVDADIRIAVMELRIR